MARADDLSSLLRPRRGADLSVAQGVLTAWNGTTHENTVDVAGATLADVPLVAMSDPAGLAVNDVVLLLRARSTFYILGRLIVP